MSPQFSSRPSPPRWFLRLAGLLGVIVIGAMILWPFVAGKRTEIRVRRTLLAVQEGLQRYHVKEELYPKQAMNGHTLARLLVEGGFLDATFANPWTGAPYHSDTGEDWMSYRTDSLAETYELSVVYPESEDIQFQLDSTTHQSLD